MCYVSKESKNLTLINLQEILDQTSLKNNESGISGILIHTLGRFFQIMEGPKNEILKLYKKIELDIRHTEILELYNDNINTYYFKKYSSTFEILETSSDIESGNQYLLNFEDHPFAEKIKGMLKAFKIS